MSEVGRICVWSIAPVVMAYNEGSNVIMAAASSGVL